MKFLSKIKDFVLGLSPNFIAVVVLVILVVAAATILSNAFGGLI